MTESPPLTPPPVTPPAGWYPDPSGAPGQLYWDGQKWGEPPKPPKKSHKLRNGLLIGAGVLVALAIVSNLTGSPADEYSVATTPSPSAGAYETPAAAEPASDVAPMGSAVRDGKFEITNVTTAKTVGDPTNNPYMTANAQGEYIVVTMRVTNIGDEPQSYFGVNQKLIDVQGREYGAFSEGDTYMNTEVAALVKVAFDVPPGTTTATLQVHDSMFSDVVKVALT